MASSFENERRCRNSISLCGSAQPVRGAMDQGIISHLRTAYMKLQQADHDYLGHRARAAHHIVAALRHLGASSLTGSGIPPGAGRLAQAQSDALLRDALFRLNIVHNELGTRIRTAAHHGSVRRSVTAAMGELNL